MDNRFHGCEDAGGGMGMTSCKEACQWQIWELVRIAEMSPNFEI